VAEIERALGEMLGLAGSAGAVAELGDDDTGVAATVAPATKEQTR
jgi:hypothetical protein